MMILIVAMALVPVALFVVAVIYAICRAGRKADDRTDRVSGIVRDVKAKEVREK